MKQPTEPSHVENAHDISMPANLEAAMKQQQESDVTWTAEEERTAVRKLDLCLIPL